MNLREIMNSKNTKVLKIFKENYCDKFDCFIGVDRSKDCMCLWKCAYWSTVLDNKLQQEREAKEELLEGMKVIQEELNDNCISNAQLIVKQFISKYTEKDKEGKT